MKQAPLFHSHKERALFGLLLGVVFACNVLWHYYSYLHFIAQKRQSIEAEVLNQYQKTKNGKSYFVLKLQGAFGIFYTTSKEDLQNLQGRRVRMLAFSPKLSFYEYLTSFYLPTHSLALLPKTPRSHLYEFISSQHQSPQMANFYQTLFLATPPHLSWRHFAQQYGISHLFALSGFHIALIGAIFFWSFGRLYGLVHARFFPYRNFYFDCGLLLLGLLVLYYLVLAYSPSYLRSLGMAFVGWGLLLWGIDALKIESFFWSVGILLSLFPKLIFSVGFYFSCYGVLCILLFFTHCYSKGFRFWLAFQLALFVSMFGIVHYFFPLFTPYLLLSIPLSLLFGIFYPLSIVLHLVGFGSFFDEGLLAWQSYQIPTTHFQLSFIWVVLLHLLLLASLFSKRYFYGFLGFNALLFLYALFVWLLQFFF